MQEGFDVLPARIASQIRKKWAGWEPTNLQKWPEGDIQTLTFNVKNDYLQVRTCSKTILAFPPLYPKMKNILSSMTPMEYSILRSVQLKKFAASAWNIPAYKYTKHKVYIVLQPKPPMAGIGFLVPQFQYPSGDGSLLALTRQDKDGVRLLLRDWK